MIDDDLLDDACNAYLAAPGRGVLLDLANHFSVVKDFWKASRDGDFVAAKEYATELWGEVPRVQSASLRARKLAVLRTSGFRDSDFEGDGTQTEASHSSPPSDEDDCELLSAWRLASDLFGGGLRLSLVGKVTTVGILDCEASGKTPSEAIMSAVLAAYAKHGLPPRNG